MATARTIAVPIDEELREHCRAIASEHNADGSAALAESDDLYQSDHFVGGWAPRGTHGPGFYFSYYSPDGGDYIFCITLEQALTVAAGGSVDLRGEYWKRSPIGPYGRV